MTIYITYTRGKNFPSASEFPPNLVRAFKHILHPCLNVLNNMFIISKAQILMIIAFFCIFSFRAFFRALFEFLRKQLAFFRICSNTVHFFFDFRVFKENFFQLSTLNYFANMKVLTPYCAIIGLLRKSILSYVSETCSLKHQEAQKCTALNRMHPLWLRNRCLLPNEFWGICFKKHLVTFGLRTSNSFKRQIIALD